MFRPTGGLTGKYPLTYRMGGVGDIYRELADRPKVAILGEPSDSDGQTMFELCARLAAKHGLRSSWQAISQHLDVLESAGLVRITNGRQDKFHHLDTSPLDVIAKRWRRDRERRRR